MTLVRALTLFGEHPSLPVRLTQEFVSSSIKSVEFSSLPSMENSGPEKLVY